MSFWEIKYIILNAFKTKNFIFIFLLAIYYLWSQNYKKTNQRSNYKSNINNINDIKNLKKVVYTALLGNYDKAHPIAKEDGYDYFMLTDQKFKNNSKSNWTYLHIGEEIKSLNLSTFKLQRYFKTHPHLYFKKYNLSIYIDASFEIKGNLDEFLLRILTPKLSIYVLEHPDRNSVNNEFGAVILARKDTNKTVTLVRNKYNRENFPDNYGLSENCLIIRKHNELRCINYMNDWFHEIKQNSHRDQLSFNYILWKTGNKDVKYISKKYIDKYFEQNPNHLINIEFKRNRAM